MSNWLISLTLKSLQRRARPNPCWDLNKREEGGRGKEGERRVKKARTRDGSLGFHFLLF